MVEILARKGAEKIIDSGASDQKNYSIIKYGLELMLSSLIGILIVAVISALCGFPFLWIAFLTAFIPLRTTAGGYHASTHIGCNIIFAVVYISCALVCKTIILNTITYLSIAVATLVVIYLFSPVEANNKPLNDVRKRNNRNRSIYIGVINLLIAMLLWVCHYQTHIFSMYYLGVLSATLSQVVAVILNRKEGN